LSNFIFSSQKSRGRKNHVIRTRHPRQITALQSRRLTICNQISNYTGIDNLFLFRHDFPFCFCFRVLDLVLVFCFSSSGSSSFHCCRIYDQQSGQDWCSTSGNQFNFLLFPLVSFSVSYDQYASKKSQMVSGLPLEFFGARHILAGTFFFLRCLARLECMYVAHG